MTLDRFRPVRGQKVDLILLLAVLALLAFGLTMISSASVVVALKDYGSTTYFFVKQLWAAVIGLACLIVFSMVEYRQWGRIAPWIGLAIALALILPHLPGIGVVVNGAQRWVRVAGVSFQLSEPVKLLAILYVAAWLTNRPDQFRGSASHFWSFVLILSLLVVPVLLQPDAGTAVTIAAVLVSMYIVAGAPVSHSLGLMALGGIGLVGILQSPYRAERLLVFLNPSQASLGAGYHIAQSLLAIGSGGWFGLGFGQSNQKYLFLPEVHTDSIFAIATEELGFLRMFLVLALVALVVVRGLVIARQAPDSFARLTAFGISVLIAFQVIVNVGAMLGVLPLTGVTLPFMSYGGSSLVTMLAATGILLSVSKHRTTYHDA